MKVLLCHNYYQHRGGEDEIFEEEGKLLEAHGHQVVRYTRHNDEIRKMRSLAVARQTLWSPRTYRELRGLIKRERPDVVHCTNTFPLISPSAYYAARAEGVPVVQWLQNYRLFCANATMLRNGRVCEHCLGRRIPWPAVAHACYRGSRSASAVVAAMQLVHRLIGTWRRAVDLYLTPTEFVRGKMIEAGLPADKLYVKPNFVLSDPGVGSGSGGYAVFVGRLSAEKGIATLLEAWSGLHAPLPLKVVGDGPLAAQVQQAAAKDARIVWVGRQPLAEVLRIVGEAACLIMPSVWYETFGRTMIEAYCRGTPVIASGLGAMVEIVDDGRTGRLFRPGDASDLAQKVALTLADAESLAAMRRAARTEFEQKYTSAISYQRLLDVYRRVCRESDAAGAPAGFGGDGGVCPEATATGELS